MIKYKFKTELKKELLQGRKIVFLADKFGITRQHLSAIICGRTYTTLIIANALVKAENPDKEVKDFFDEFDTKIKRN